MQQRCKTNITIKTSLAFLFASALVLAPASLPGREASPSATPAKSQPSRIEVCFVLDTTGSMGGLIEGAKQKIWSIANEMISAKPTPEIRMGLVAYRDRGDEYVVKNFDLTNDIDAVYANLCSFQAGGGGDTPESVKEALHEAVTRMSWSADRSVLKIIFLVGDAPPHMDYDNTPKYPEVCQAAMKRDLIINTVQCGGMAETTTVWQEIAKLGESSFAAIPQTGGMVAIATPLDEELAKLNRELGTTLVAYGSESVRRSVLAKQVAAEAAAPAVAADRLKFNYAAGKTVQGEGELLDALARGSLSLETIQKDQLPAEWRNLEAPELQTRIAAKQKQRAELQARIQALSRQRDDYIAAERTKVASTGKGDAFDEQVARAIRSQAARKGMVYGRD